VRMRNCLIPYWESKLQFCGMRKDLAGVCSLRLTHGGVVPTPQTLSIVLHRISQVSAAFLILPLSQFCGARYSVTLLCGVQQSVDGWRFRCCAVFFTSTSLPVCKLLGILQMLATIAMPSGSA
jgi:hypothetical protein